MRVDHRYNSEGGGGGHSPLKHPHWVVVNTEEKTEHSDTIVGPGHDVKGQKQQRWKWSQVNGLT